MQMTSCQAFLLHGFTILLRCVLCDKREITEKVLNVWMKKSLIIISYRPDCTTCSGDFSVRL